MGYSHVATLLACALQDALAEIESKPKEVTSDAFMPAAIVSGLSCTTRLA
jgi:hypothetical protein